MNDRSIRDGQRPEDPIEGVVERAVDQTRMLAGENPGSPYPEDANHWLSVYADLLARRRAPWGGPARPTPSEPL
jgi:hypothetical protein